MTYYSEASDGLEAQLADLAKAEEFIFMEYHAIEEKESFGRIRDVLADRAAHGVEVRVFYDDMGSIGFINTDFVKRMEALGIQCRVFNPFSPGLNLFLNNRDHRKITVIDGTVGYTGGYNLANEYFNIDAPYGYWKDTGLRLEGNGVAGLTAAFLEMWHASLKTEEEDRDFARYLPRTQGAPRTEGFVQPYADGPMAREHVAENVYISMAETARDYAWFITPYLRPGGQAGGGRADHHPGHPGQEAHLPGHPVLLQRPGPERGADLRVHPRLLPLQDVRGRRPHGHLRHHQPGLPQPVPPL